MAFGALVALSTDGWPRSGMGVDAADIDGDGWQDLFVSNLDKEMFALYRNTGHGDVRRSFVRRRNRQGTYYLSGWGLKFFDFDNDGTLDLILANGHPDDLVAERSAKVRYREPMLLFQQKDGQFRNVSAQAGPVFQGEYSARGLAIGDYDNDGRADVLVGVNGGAPLLLRNDAVPGNHWLGVRLRGVKANRDGVGAQITWEAGGVDEVAAQDGRRQLPVGPRSARDPGARPGHAGGSGGSPLAGSQRPRGAVLGPGAREVLDPRGGRGQARPRARARGRTPVAVVIGRPATSWRCRGP